MSNNQLLEEDRMTDKTDLAELRKRYWQLVEAIPGASSDFDKRPLEDVHASALRLVKEQARLLDLAHETLKELGFPRGVLDLENPSARKANSLANSIEVQVRLLFEKQGAKIAKQVGELLPPGVGFALFLFEFGEGGNMAWYMANAQREDSRRLIAEWLHKTRDD